MKQTNSNLLRLVEKALAQCGHHSAEISIKLSPSRQLANVRAGKKRFSVLLSERPERDILNCGGFALSEDGIATIRACKIRFLFFHCGTAGILQEARKGPHSMVFEYHDEFGSKIWTYLPLNPLVKL